MLSLGQGFTHAAWVNPAPKKDTHLTLVAPYTLELYDMFCMGT